MRGDMLMLAVGVRMRLMVRVTERVRVRGRVRGAFRVISDM